MKLPRTPDKTVTLDMKQMHIYMLVVTLGTLILGFGSAALIHQQWTFSVTTMKFFTFLLFYIVGIIAHEGFHLIGFMLWGKCRPRDLVFGINRELGIAYAGTKKTLRNSVMIKTLLLPFFPTGLLPFVVGIYLNNGVLITVASILIGGAVGDFAMYNQLRKVDKNAYIIDDLERPQLYVYNENPTVEN